MVRFTTAKPESGVADKSVAYSAIVDFVLALLPWKIILSLQMQRHEKIGVAVAMSLGLL